MIYLHGGCFVLGSIHSHQALVSHIADKCKIPILFIEYSLAPENPFPSAINEILEVYQQLLKNSQPKDILFMGDSAGSALCMSVISILNRKNLALPKQLIMISPWIDLRCNSQSITGNAAIDPVLTKEQLQTYTALYLGGSNLPEANPIETLYGVFPPTLILTGSREILLDDSSMAYNKISETQPLTKWKVSEGQTHVWLLDDIGSDASREAIEEISQFVGN
jgi:acetyl esterase/lipase